MENNRTNGPKTDFDYIKEAIEFYAERAQDQQEESKLVDDSV